MNNWYHQGRRAHQEGHGKQFNPYARRSKQASWWLAGWNDRDIEVKNESVSS